MSDKITPQPKIMDIALYQGGASKVDGIENVVKLSSNENFAEAAADLHRYPNTDHIELRAAIAQVHDLDPERIICGVGSDEIIAFLCQCYAGVGDEVIYPEHGFSMYKISARAAGAEPIAVPERDRVVDVDAILAACTEHTKLVFIANPANPTGTMVDMSEVERLAAELPDHVLLVLDGAYAEYVEGFDGGASLVAARENVFMTRTFSKIYGLGGARIGWGYGPQEIVDVLNRVRGPFNLSEPQLAAATAAVLDLAWIEKCRDDNTHLRAVLTDGLRALGLAVDPSFANFVLIQLKDEAQAIACDAYLRENGVIARLVAGYGLPQCIRVTVGDEAACRRVIRLIKDFLEAAA